MQGLVPGYTPRLEVYPLVNGAPMRVRVSAYALAIRDNHVLMTQLAEKCTRGGSWTLPGGGMDHGEQPLETLVREVYEETGLHAAEPELLHAGSYSETTYGPYMAVQLVYRVNMSGEPQVQELGGTTADVAWIPLAKLGGMKTVPFVDQVLAGFVA